MEGLVATELEMIGQLLKSHREEKQLTLKACENATSIRLGFLQAIEEGKIRDYLEGIYVFGFVKQYAEFLGANIEIISKQFPQALSTQEKPHEFSYGIGTLEMRGSLGGGVKWLPNLFWALGVTGIIVVAYYFARAIGVL